MAPSYAIRAHHIPTRVILAPPVCLNVNAYLAAPESMEDLAHVSIPDPARCPFFFAACVA
jgi:hypothetical protein